MSKERLKNGSVRVIPADELARMKVDKKARVDAALLMQDKHERGVAETPANANSVAALREELNKLKEVVRLLMPRVETLS